MAKKVPEDLGAVERSAHTRAASGEKPNRAEERLRKRAKRRTIHLSRIVESRFQSPSRRGRRTVADLAESIAALGLINAPVVRKCANGKYELISGHRRVFAWRLLMAQNRAPNTIAVDVLEDMSDLEAALAVRAANRHEEVGPVAEAEETGRIRGLLAAELGREPTVRDLAPVMPKGRTAVGEALEIWQALQDPRLEPLVRQADKAGKSLLVKALRADEFLTTRAALEAFALRGVPGMRKALSQRKGGRPFIAASRRKRGSDSAYDVTVRIRPTMSSADAREALALVQDVTEDLQGLLESADEQDTG